ncbi:hypothetical protein AgCh_003249 [Apium graveolens]
MIFSSLNKLLKIEGDISGVQKMKRGLDGVLASKRELENRELGVARAECARLHESAVNAFESGYGQCLGRMGSFGVDVAGHDIDSYFASLRGRSGKDGTGSSNHPEGGAET